MAMTFRVNLLPSDYLSHRQPYNITDIDTFLAQRSTWFPDIFGDNRKLKHGDEFTAEGTNAIYIKDNYTTGEFKFIDYVSGTAY